MNTLDAATLGGHHTIAAVATPSGRGALAMIRVSGPEARKVASMLLDPPPTVPRHATRCFVRADDGTVIDDVLATLFIAPYSFTGEDLLEITTHGGLVVPTTILAAVIRAGACVAEPGEFTRRAVLNRKLDLLQAEAIGDLVDARSSAAHRLAMRQLDGGLSRRIASLRQRLLGLEALLAYDIDFPDEDNGPIPHEHIVTVAEDLIRALETLLATGEHGTLVHDGALVVLAGAPNVGKSSLFNALLGEARAIVTEVPGTTRDAIEAIHDLPGWPLRLVDTAGIRDTTDLIEQLGIETSSRYLARAALVLACVDSAESAQEVDRLREYTEAPIITVAMKCDLPTSNVSPIADIAVSAQTGEGLANLLRMIEGRVADNHGVPVLDAPALTRARHRAAVSAAVGEVAMFLTVWRDEMLPASVAATHIRAAANALSELIGAVYTDDILDVVFRSFCVGK